MASNLQRHNEFLDLIARRQAERQQLEQKIANVGYTNITSSIEQFLEVNDIKSSSNIRLLNITYRGRNVIQVKTIEQTFKFFTRQKL